MGKGQDGTPTDRAPKSRSWEPHPGLGAGEGHQALSIGGQYVWRGTDAGGCEMTNQPNLSHRVASRMCGSCGPWLWSILL